MSIWVDDLVYYPIKSLEGNHLQRVKVTQQGLWQDRRYQLVNEDGKFITARKKPKLCLLQVKCLSLLDAVDPTWEVRLPEAADTKQPPLIIDPQNFDTDHGEVTIWKSTLTAQFCGKRYDEWFSEYLGQPVRLVWFSDQSQRQSSQKGNAPSAPVAFADAYPLLLTSRASLTALNQLCPEFVEMRQFRPNIIVDGCNAFEEETWETFRIGDVTFQSVIPCVRCIFTTLNPYTAEPSANGEPLKTLSEHRLWTENGKKLGPIFGMNVIAKNGGNLAKGNALEVLSHREAPALWPSST